MRQKTMLKYLLGLVVLIAVVAMGTTVRNAISASPEIVRAAPAISAAEIDSYLSGKGSPLAGHGQVFVDKGRQYDIDPRLVAAIAGAESTFATNGQCASERNNAWGWGGGWPSCWQFDSWDEGIDTVTEGLRRLYFDGGLDGVIRDTIPLIGEKYCPGCLYWVNNVTLFYQTELGGDPGDLTFQQAQTAPPGFRLPFVGTYYITAGPGCTSEHTGALNGEAIDFGLPEGAEVLATEAGTAYTSYDPISGNVVHVVHPNSLKSIYVHLSSFNVTNGQFVSMGQVVGLSGSTGTVSGAHLHFAVLTGYSSSTSLDGTSVWIRDMPGITWYSGDPNNPCQPPGYYDGYAVGPVVDAIPPDGGYTSPEDGTIIQNTVMLRGWAEDNPGGSGVDYVHFTAQYDGSWHSINRDYDEPYELLADFSAVSDQRIELGFDIYDKAGNYAWSPHGTRTIVKDATPPDGAYTSPSNGAHVGNSVFLQGWATDNLSGVDYVNFTAKYDGSWHTVHTDHSSPYEYTWDLSGIADQTIELGFDIYDKAGNYAWSPHGKIQIVKDTGPTPTPTPGSDTTPPTNPTSCVELNGAQNNAWQNSIGHPTFSWSGADGTGSDIAGYYHTFSTDPNGTSDYFTTSNTFDFDFSTGWPTGVPYYLRVRTKDTSGNLATEWKTIFIFKYDPVPPTVSFDRANGIPISASGQSVYSNVTNWTFEGTANDSGSGLNSIVFGGWGNNYGAGWNDTVGTSSPWSYSQNGLSGHNRIHFWAIDKANNVSERRYIELYVDLASPSTIASPNGTMGENGWYRSPVQVALFATDYGSGSAGTIGGIPNHYIAGVDHTRYRVDGGSWQTYSGSFSVSGDGTHTVDYYSVDAVGNEEGTQSLTIKIDTNPPTGSLSINRGASTSYSLNVVLGLSASDGLGSGVSQMRFSNSNPDWGEWETYATERAWKLTDGSGSKTVYVQLQDTAGNISEYSASLFVDLYPDKPASQNYRIFKSVVGVAGGSKGSENYKIGNTTGQPAMGPAPERSQSSESFRLVTGYWAMQPWPLFGDFNHDCKVGIEDIMQVASRWRTSCAIPDPDNDVNTPNYEKTYDIDHDCDIDIVDIMKVVVHWGETCP